MDGQTNNQDSEQQIIVNETPRPVEIQSSSQLPATAQPDATKVRLITLALLAGLILLPLAFIWVGLWLELTKHYKLSAIIRGLILLLCGFIGPVIAIVGAVAGLDTYGFYYPVMIPGIVLTIAPFLFSLTKPVQES